MNDIDGNVDEEDVEPYKMSKRDSLIIWLVIKD